MREFICPPGCHDRLDKVVAQLAPDISRGEARKLIAAGTVLVNGQPRRIASRLVRPGERLRIVEDSDTSVVATLQVVHEDAECIAIDKPASMPSAPTRSGAAGTAFELMRAQLGTSALWLVHRLDTGTSGVLLFAKTKGGAARWSEAFREQRVRKTYVALVEGKVEGESGCVDLPLASQASRSFVSPEGRPAKTSWRVLARHENETLLELQPHSGRMHQIRVHLQAIAHPVVGDRQYGGRAAPRLMLHAQRLELAASPPHKAKIIQAPIPSEFR